ncbi:class I SAM-dependent methyltransferase [Pedobacter frigoris]|uniref:Class I SAM-dependent methyltransferase n=1 Tax=Pedobacter frigoris TaxID=2571272 RepID=A0A4U1CDC1_9SPHI|nr:class I SAM-dependent methyltransferase [Pedobacter frigoris]TKC04138.1 class I SAM-dependent methyltransferase [Pedobacter frigoris]
MEKEWNDEDWHELASQLSEPQGDAGIKTGEMMASSNENMIFRTIDLLGLRANEEVLEIGHGSASHLSTLMRKASGLEYTGIDISLTMIEEAKRINTAFIESGSVSFYLSDGLHIDFSDNQFDKIFTVNTLYFWKDPEAYAKEIYRVLKPGGRFCLAIATKDFMEKLPFTKWIFQLYDRPMVEELLSAAGFSIQSVAEEKDFAVSKTGEQVERDIIIVTAGK